MKTFFYFLFLFIFSFSLSGQHCQTDQDWCLQRLLENKEFLAQNQTSRKADINVPLVFHIISDNDGTGGASEDQVYDLLCLVNEHFNSGGFTFYLKEQPNHINNGMLYNNFLNNATGGRLIPILRDSALNIFTTFSINAFQSPIASTEDFIAISNGEVERLSHLLSHELGHVFSLLHTYHGWTDPSVLNMTKAPENDFLNQPTEYQDSTNCETGGDRICDTPPDYIGGFFPAGCDYDGGIMDPSCTPIDPMENNIMTFYQCQSYKFTAQQFEVMEAEFENPRKNYLRVSYQPIATGTPDLPVLIAPNGQAMTNANNELIADWDPVNNGAFFIFELSTNRFFSQVIQTFSTTETSVLLENLDFGQTYYWRVTAYSESGCSITSDVSEFEVNGSTNTSTLLESEHNLKIYPNPIKGNFIYGDFNTSKSQQVEIKLFQFDGKLIHQQSMNFHQGENTFSISTDNLPEGIFYIKMEMANSTISKKVMLLK